MKIKRCPIGPLWTNCYLVWDSTKHGFLVDPGGDASELGMFACTNDITIDWVLLTHGHYDHIAGLADARNVAENGVAIHENDADFLRKPELNLSQSFGERPAAFLVAEKTLTDGEIIHVGQMTIEVISTPGHTRGSVCFYVKEGEEKLLLAGDTLFCKSVGRTDHPTGDSSVLQRSLVKLYNLPDDLAVYPGHGHETTIGYEKRNNPYFCNIN